MLETRKGEEMKVGDLVKHKLTDAVGVIMQMPRQDRRASDMMSVMKFGSIVPQRWKQRLCEAVNESR